MISGEKVEGTEDRDLVFNVDSLFLLAMYCKVMYRLYVFDVDTLFDWLYTSPISLY